MTDATEVARPSSAAGRYLQRAAEVVAAIIEHEHASIAAAGALCADAIARGGLIHAFGTGHSHMVAEELFYRAGGLAAVHPVFDERLMLHVSATGSTQHERTAAVGDEIVARLSIRPTDVILLASNSGGNAVVDAVAAHAVAVGAPVIALVSRAHVTANGRDVTPPLLALATVVIDNHGIAGDAAVELEGVPQRIGPTSTIAAAAIVNAIAVDVVERLAARGIEVPVFASSNAPGGDRHNETVLAAYRDRIPPL